MTDNIIIRGMIMPQVEFTKEDIEKLLGFEIDPTQLETYFMPAKSELDSYSDGVIKLDGTDTNRPDLWGVEGIVRELKGHLGLEKGIPKYKFDKSDYSVEVFGKNSFNPKATAAVIRGVDITEDLLVSMINFQEKVVNSYGGKRSEFAIGIYALDKVNGKKLKYTVVDKNTKFVPLGFDDEMTLEDVLKKHPKGKEFGFLLDDMDKYPVWMDEKGEIMSLPPIINSNKSGKVELGKQDLFMEVTGKNQNKIDLVLLIGAMAFADRGAKVERVSLNYIDENKSFVSLNNEPLEISFDKQKIYNYVGEKLTDEQIKEFLGRKHYEVSFESNKIKLKYPKYRYDILHPVDVIEDLLIEYGYNILKPTKLDFYTVGGLLDSTEFNNLVREAGIGLGLQELVTFTLTSKKKQYENMNIKNVNSVEIANPMSESISIFRERILPEHLDVLVKNQHISYPQDVFELGRVVSIYSQDGVEQHKEETHLCVTLCHNRANYTEIKQKLDALLKAIDAKDVQYKPKDYSFLIPNRSAVVTFKLGDKSCTGYIGEVSPDVLTNFGLNKPVAVFEISVDKYN